MNHQLFKELKDAGFPEPKHKTAERPDSWVDKNNIVYDWFSNDDCVYVPTLEELIEAMGTNFDVLKLTDSGWYAASNKTDFPQGNRIEVAGWRTPLIACAKLYIALSK